MKLKFFPPYKDEGEVVVAWGEAQLIKYLDGKTKLCGAQIRTGQKRGSESRCFCMRRWWKMLVDGVEIGVDLDCLGFKVEGGMVEMRVQLRAV